MPVFATIVLVNLLVLLLLGTGLWLVSLAKRDASIVDPCWGLGFVIVAWVTAWQSGGTLPRGWLMIGLVTLWGLRLSGFLTLRNRGHGEDRRYAAMRHKHGPRFWWVSFLTVFCLQAVLMWIISMPVQATVFEGSGWAGADATAWLTWLGVAAWTVGFFFESVGDWQMARFRARSDSAGKVMDRGLWRYTRHPNYFGDFCVWWGLFAIAAAGGHGWTVFSPLLMSLLLLRVSGVSLLEKDISQRRPGYRDYVHRTSSFFPWPPVRADRESD